MRLITNDQFDEQVQALKTRFGDRAFDDEFISLIDAELEEITYPYFKRVVANLIGGRRPNDPPLLIHFKEAFIAERKRLMNQKVERVSKNFFESRHMSLDQVLKKHYPGCKTVTEAMAYEAKRIRECD
jgi:hypothetical protein